MREKTRLIQLLRGGEKWEPTYTPEEDFTMQTIQLHAAPLQDYHFPETVDLLVSQPLQESKTNLDDCLATVLQAVQQSKNPRAMDALGTLLAYMESLEKNQIDVAAADEPWLTLTNPVTMSL